MIMENTITINAPVARIYALAVDVVRWPEILPHYRWVTLVSETCGCRIVEMAASRDGIPVKWTSILEPVPDEHR